MNTTVQDLFATCHEQTSVQPRICSSALVAGLHDYRDMIFAFDSSFISAEQARGVKWLFMRRHAMQEHF